MSEQKQTVIFQAYEMGGTAHGTWRMEAHIGAWRLGVASGYGKGTVAEEAQREAKDAWLALHPMCEEAFA